MVGAATSSLRPNAESLHPSIPTPEPHNDLPDLTIGGDNPDPTLPGCTLPQKLFAVALYGQCPH